jgi:hypothetical protein
MPNKFTLPLSPAVGDAASTGATNFGWPGDVTTISSVQTFADMLISNDFLKAQDVAKVFSCAGMKQAIPTGSNAITLAADNVGFSFYRVSRL